MMIRSKEQIERFDEARNALKFGKIESRSTDTLQEDRRILLSTHVLNSDIKQQIPTWVSAIDAELLRRTIRDAAAISNPDKKPKDAPEHSPQTAGKKWDEKPTGKLILQITGGIILCVITFFIIRALNQHFQPVKP